MSGRLTPFGVLTIGDLCEAFAHGRAAEAHARLGLKPELWTLVNRLAHGSFPELARLAAPPSPAPPLDPGGWPAVEADLAGLLIRLAPSPDLLRATQEAALWPLEETLRGVEPASGPSIPELRCLVVSAVAEAALG